MIVKVIGSGSMWNEHNSASYMIDNDILIDFPNGTCKNLFRMNIEPKSINNILITHFHGDHYFDIPFYFPLKTKDENKNVNIHCSKEGKKKIYNLTKLAFPKSAKSILKSINVKYNFQPSFKVNNYVVEKHIVDHGHMKPAYGYIIKDANKKVGFTGDTSLCETVEYMSKECNYLFCDCMFIEGTDKHMGIDNLKYLSKKYKNCTYVVSHLENNTREELKKSKYDNIIIPEDGEVINI